MDGICVVIRKAPYGTLAAAEGLRHFLGAAGCGMAATAVLVDDGIYLAKDGQDPAGTGWTNLSGALRQALDPTAAGLSPPASVYVHRPSVHQRGMDDADLVAGVKLIADDELAAMVATAEGLLIF